MECSPSAGDYSWSLQPIHNIFPSLTVPPSSSVILDEKGSVVQGDIGPFNELSTLILTCDVLGGELGRERRNDWIVSGLMKLRVSSCARRQHVTQRNKPTTIQRGTKFANFALLQSPWA